VIVFVVKQSGAIRGYIATVLYLI